MEKEYLWIDFYEQLATALLGYRNNRKELIAKCKESGIVFPKDENDIDPFTFYALFNRSSQDLNAEKRLAICKSLKEVLKLDADAPTGFFGVPLMLDFQKFFDKPGKRKDSDIEHLWEVFEAALAITDDSGVIKAEGRERFVRLFDEVELQHKVCWNLTCGLFWIRPRSFVGLDKNNRQFIKLRYSDIGQCMPDLDHKKNGTNGFGVSYLSLCDALRARVRDKYDDIPHFSHAAYAETKESKSMKTEELDETTKGLVGCLVKELEQSKNLVLTGAPGTGKTWLARKIAKQLAVKDSRIGFVQFHPSYDYTDFVEGLRPIDDSSENGGGFERQDGIFKKFCADALSGFAVDAIDNFEEAYEHLIEKINDSAGERVEVQNLSHKGTFPVSINERETGLASRTYAADGKEWIRGASKFFSKEQLYNVYRGMSGTRSGGHDCYRRAVIEYMKNNCGLREYKVGRNVPIGETAKYVFIIDEINRGDISKIFGELFFAIDPGYRGVGGLVSTQYQSLVHGGPFDPKFYVPENVYIIATMNDIDRSVESMDFAIRRRFRWHEIKPSDNAEMLNQLPHEFAEKARSTMDSINRWIDNEAGLGSAFEIGPAYFLKLNKELSLNDAFEDLLRFHIEPLLREYLRGQGDLETKLESAREAFRKPDGAN